MSYLHGVQVKQNQSAVIFREANTAVLGLVGIAEKGSNSIQLITNLAQAETEYGNDLEGTTIMSALKSFFADGGCQVLVVNVASGAKLTNMIDSGTNKVKLISGALCTQVHNEVLASTTGLVNFKTELIAGLDVLKTASSTFGVKPNFILVPGYSQVKDVADKMKLVATDIKGKAIVDIPATTVAGAITKRNGDYNYSDKRALVCFPNGMAYNEFEAKDVEIPYSQLLANEIVNTHFEKGYWISPSNRELKSIKGTKVQIISSLTDESADTNMLNAQGIITIYREGFSGFRTWGNWTSKFPSISNHEAQIAPSIVKDVIDESIQRESLAFLDRNIDYPTLDFIVANVQNFLYGLKGKGALVDGSISYSQEKNPITEISQGKFVFDLAYCENPSLDRITYESVQDLNMLKSLFKS